ncbi:MAG: hypothetical protein LCH90_17195, partial [Proteobacteria bacterium]|nr:hypothetical protein [Pseudomonadota bacterium]
IISGPLDDRSDLYTTIDAFIPMLDEWSAAQIAAESKRKGHNIDLVTLRGCISSLVCSGIVRELPGGKFSRIHPRPKAAPQVKRKEEDYVTTKPEAARPEPRRPTEILGQLASRVSQIAADAKKLGADIEAAAIEMEDQMKATSEEIEALRQLRSILNVIREK